MATRGGSLLMEGVEAGLRARGVSVSRWDPDEQAAAAPLDTKDDAVVVFDQDELSCGEVACLREGVGQGVATLLGLSRDSCFALRYRVERVVLRGLRDLLPDAVEGQQLTAPG
ncbi:MAG: hypothetical protein V3U26_05695 [Dehalococcoidia bacterium]